VGAILYGTQVDTVVPAGRGRHHVLHLLQRIQARPGVSPPGATDLAELLRAAQLTLRRRASVFVVSDFISAPGWHTALARLAMRHEVTAVRLFDPLERTLPDLGGVTLRDAESGEELWVDTHDRGFRARFEALAREREQTLRDGLAHAGVDTLELATDDDLFEALVRFTELRKQHSRLSGGSASGARSPWASHLAVGGTA
jgi:uncharacterized protein (DUF58 family)